VSGKDNAGIRPTRKTNKVEGRRNLLRNKTGVYRVFNGTTYKLTTSPKTKSGKGKERDFKLTVTRQSLKTQVEGGKAGRRGNGRWLGRIT